MAVGTTETLKSSSLAHRNDLCMDEPTFGLHTPRNLLIAIVQSSIFASNQLSPSIDQ